MRQVVIGYEPVTFEGTRGRNAQHDPHRSRFFLGVTAPFVDQSSAPTEVRRRAHEFSSAPSHSTHLWACTQRTGTRTQRLTNQQTHSPSNCRRDSGHSWIKSTRPLKIGNEDVQLRHDALNVCLQGTLHARLRSADRVTNGNEHTSTRITKNESAYPHTSARLFSATSPTLRIAVARSTSCPLSTRVTKSFSTLSLLVRTRLHVGLLRRP